MMNVYIKFFIFFVFPIFFTLDGVAALTEGGCIQKIQYCTENCGRSESGKTYEDIPLRALGEGKILIIVYTANYCAPCKIDHQYYMGELYRQIRRNDTLRNKVEVVALSFDSYPSRQAALADTPPASIPPQNRRSHVALENPPHNYYQYPPYKDEDRDGKRRFFENFKVSDSTAAATPWVQVFNPKGRLVFSGQVAPRGAPFDVSGPLINGLSALYDDDETRVALDKVGAFQKGFKDSYDRFIECPDKEERSIGNFNSFYCEYTDLVNQMGSPNPNYLLADDNCYADLSSTPRGPAAATTRSTSEPAATPATTPPPGSGRPTVRAD